MFKKLKSMVGEQPTVDTEQDDLYLNSFDDGKALEDLMAEPEVNKSNAEDVLNDSSAPYELRKEAMRLIKERYLKPKDEDELD